MSFYDLFNFHIFYFLIFSFYIQDLYSVSYDFLLWLITLFPCTQSKFRFLSFFPFFYLAISWFLHHPFLIYAHPFITLFSFPVLSVFEPHPYSHYPVRPHRRHRIHHYPYADHIWRYQFFHFLLNLSIFLITLFPLSDVLVSWFSLIYNSIRQHV